MSQVNEAAPGRLTAIERLEFLFDRGALAEVERVPGLVLARGEIAGVPAFGWSRDAAEGGGALTLESASRLLACEQAAAREAAPGVGIFDGMALAESGGAALLQAITRLLALAAGRKGGWRRFAAVLGPAWGTDALLVAAADLVVASSDARIAVTGPDVLQHLGVGDDDRIAASAPCDARNDAAALWRLRRLIEAICVDRPRPPVDPSEVGLRRLLPRDPLETYDMLEVARAIADDGDVLEVGAAASPEALTGFLRIDGRRVALLATQPAEGAGLLTSEGMEKLSRFLAQAAGANLPLVRLVDAAGFMPGPAEEARGLAQRAVVLAGGLAAFPAPTTTVVTRSALGGAGAVLCSGRVGAWPQARIGLSRESAAAGSDIMQPEDTRRWVRSALWGDR